MHYRSIFRTLFPIIAPVLLILLGGCGDDDCSTKPCPGQEKIYGQVTGGLGPISDARIRVVTLEMTVPEQHLQLVAETDDNGRFSIAVPPGHYGVEMSAPGLGRSLWYSASGYKPAIYDADTIRVTAAGDSAQVDFILGGVEIRLQTPSLLDEFRLTCSLEDSTSAYSVHQIGSDPQTGERIITFEAVPPGTYFARLSVMPPALNGGSSFWLPPTLDRSAAQSFQIDPSEISYYSIDIPEPAYIQGTIGGRWAELEAGLPKIKLHNLEEIIAGSYYADDLGIYNIPIFTPDSLRLKVSLGYSVHWVGGEDFSSAQIFDIVPGAIVAVDPVMIGGLQCRLAGDPLWEPYDAIISVFDPEGNTVTKGSLGADNIFTIPLFSTDAHKLKIEWGDSAPWRPQWFNQAATFEEASSIYLPAEGEIVTVLVALEKGGTISGEITDSFEEPAGNLPFFVKSTDQEWHWSYKWRTDTDGGYLIDGLPDGDFIIGIRHPTGALITWYPGTADVNSAQAITILDAQDVTGIDFRLHSSLFKTTP